MSDVASAQEPVRLRYLAIAAALTSIGLGTFVGLGRGFPPSAWVLALVLTPAMAIAEFPTIQLRVLGRTIKHTPSSSVLLVGLLIAPPVVVGVACAVGVVTSSLLQRARPLIAWINGGQILLGIAVYLCGGRALGLDFSGGGRALLVVLALAPASLWIGDATGILAVATARRDRDFRIISPSSAISLGLDVSQAMLVGIGAALLRVDVLFVVPITIITLASVVAYRSYFRIQSANDSFRRLHSSTRSITRSADTTVERSHLLFQALDLIDAEAIELYLLQTSIEEAFLARIDRDRQYDEVVGAGAVRMASGWAGSAADEGAALVDGAIVVAFDGEEAPIGEMRLQPQFGHPFTDTDRRLVEMFANHASVALQNAQLVDRLRHDLTHDRLTSLPNRVMFDLQTRACLARRRDDELVAVMLLDLDEFKEINDTLGHDVGDQLLIELGARIAESVDHVPGAVAARLGGDEFALVVPGCRSDAEIADVASRVREAVSRPLELAGVPIDVRGSVGVSVAPRDSDSSAPLIQRADVSMYIAKRQHRGVVFYDRSDDPYSPKRLSLGADLRGAVSRGEIEAHFQPEIDAATLQVVGCEALARWTHPEHGNVFPDQFIPIAEQSGLIRDLTYHMLEQSLANIRRWRNLGHDLNVAVNLSVRCLNHPDIVEQITTRVERSGVDPDHITLEVTEGTIMDNPDHAVAVLGRLRDFGVRLSIDDFGMGISSLSQIKRLPVQQVKVDREFVKHLVHDQKDEAIVSSVVHLGHALGLEVVAEGVEDRDTLVRLQGLGVDSIQGWLIAKAMPESEFEVFLRTFDPAAMGLRPIADLADQTT